MNSTTFIKRHPVATYFALAFAISWCVFLLLVGRHGIPVPPEQAETLLPLAVLTWLAGPSLAGILLTGLVHGKAGFRELLSRLLRWRVGVRWYAVALLTAPLLMLAVLLPLSLLSPKFLPGIFTADDKTTHLLFGIIVGLMAGFFEELGWTGFAIPELRRHFGVFSAGLVVGIGWVVWHLLPAYWLSSTVSGPLALTSYLLDPLLFLLAFRIIMVKVYDRTHSLLLAMLMHASLTASARIIGPIGIAGPPLMIFDLIWAVVLWGIIVVIPVVRGRSVS